MSNVGLYAGVFDPVHDGHLDVARSAVEHLGLNNLYFLVEETPRGNKNPIDLTHRQRMLDLATENEDRITRLDIDDPSFSISATLPRLEQRFKDEILFFIFGADVFLHMNQGSWPNLEQLLKHHIVVFERGSISEKQITDHAKKLRIVVAIVPNQYPEHASTDVRLRPHETAIWVPQEVAAYITENQLYS